jgi:NlpC/P60 family
MLSMLDVGMTKAPGCANSLRDENTSITERMSQHEGNLRCSLGSHHNTEMMRFAAKHGMLAFILCRLASQSSAQGEIHKSGSFRVVADSQNVLHEQEPPTLTSDDGLSVIAAALDFHGYSNSPRDCSHLVHAIYVRAGFPYRYARSSDLYVGTGEFQRVIRLQPGDLVVWRGHVGIVVNPAQHLFYSAMRSGPGTDTYDAPYRKRRGQARFYRYIKGNRTNARGRFVLTEDK